MTVEQQFAEGDLVATRWTARGTHEGELIGIQPTGKQVTVSGMTTFRLSGGKIVEEFTQWDNPGMLQQLGAIPALAHAWNAVWGAAVRAAPLSSPSSPDGARLSLASR